MSVYSAADASKRVFTLNFDNKANENGVYFDFSDSVTYVSDPEGSGKSAQFDGASDAEVPYFQNNEFRQFTMALKLKKYANGASEQGLVYNGGNPAVADYAPPSLDISIADSTKLVARILTDDGAFSVQSSVEVITLLTTFIRYRYS
jgi:hypothetical protein